MFKWQRPQNAEFPITYCEFDGKLREDGTKRHYWIQDLTEEYFEDVIKEYLSGYIKEEPLMAYNNVADDLKALEDFKEIWKELLAEKISLICLTKDEDGLIQIVGFNCLFVIHKDDPDPEGEFRSPLTKRILDICMEVCEKKNAFEELGLDEYLYAFGLYVLKNFRGEGIGQKLLSSREEFCKTFNLKGTLTLFSSFISQKQAERCGFKDFYSIAYDELPENLQMNDISNHTKYLKFMYKMY